MRRSPTISAAEAAERAKAAHARGVAAERMRQASLAAKTAKEEFETGIAKYPSVAAAYARWCKAEKDSEQAFADFQEACYA